MFTCMQKINFISNLFFEILERHCKPVILETLGMLDHPHQYHSITVSVGNLNAYQHAKNQLNHSILS